MNRYALHLALVAALLGGGCEKIKSLMGGTEKQAQTAAGASKTRKGAGAGKQAEAKAPLAFPKDQTDAILDKQERITAETRDAFLAHHLSKAEQDDLYFEPPADETWSKLTPERR